MGIGSQSWIFGSTYMYYPDVLLNMIGGENINIHRNPSMG